MKKDFSLGFENLQSQYCQSILRFLLKSQVYFSVVSAIKDVRFSPVLPEHIIKSFRPISLFAISYYAFDSLRIEDRGISFETGFGEENIGSYVEIDYENILHIVASKNQKDCILFSRVSLSLDLSEQKSEQEFDEVLDEDLKRSKQAILSHPHNQKFFK